MVVTTTAPSSSSSRVLSFSSHLHLRHRLILSLLSRKPVRIDGIRPTATSPGLLPCEISFLRLLEKLTSGTRLEISYTGTSLLFHPGIISGGSGHVHDCESGRGIGWYLEPLLVIAMLGKKDLSLTLKGITTDGKGVSVDTLRVSGLPHLAMFLDREGLELKITKRGHPPQGGGEVTFTCPSVRAIKSGFDFTNLGKIIKIRGIAHSVRVSPQLSNRLVAAARSVLNRYIPDVYIYTDVYRGEDSGKSPGYALTLLATSTSHVHHTSESTSCPPSAPPAAAAASFSTASPLPFSPPSPEDLGILAARNLLAEIRRGGCVDRGFEWMVCTLLVLGGEDVGRVTVGGPLEGFFIQHLRDLRAFFGTSFKIKPLPTLSTGVVAPVVALLSRRIQSESGSDEEEADEELESETKHRNEVYAVEQYVLSCVGTGYTNTARKTG